MTVYNEFEWRGMIHTCTEGIKELLSKNKISAYIGFDPSSSSLHIGNLLPIMALTHLQHYGHTPIVVVGGGTGLIGDPSGKSDERPLLSEEIVSANVESIKKQLTYFLDFKIKKNPAILINNADWLTSITLSDFLRKVGKYFTINYMLDKESVKRRLVQEEGISFAEFTYMLTQAYDYLMLFNRYNCLLQMGGSDQWGNITAGIDFIKRQKGIKVHGLVFPLITTSSGTKFGKTEAGTVWLSPDRTSPFRFYQFWFNTDDMDVISYLKFFTWLPKDDIKELQFTLTSNPDKREAQRRLAREVTKLVHGDDGLRKAEKATNILFGEEITDLDSRDVLDIFSDVPSTDLNKNKLIDGTLTIVDLASECNITSSRGEAKRLIKSRGLYLNNRRIEDERYIISLKESLGGKYFILRKGPKDYHLIRVLD